MGLIWCTLPDGPFKSVVLCLFPDHLWFALQEGLGESMEGFREMQTTCRWESFKRPVSAVCFLKLFADSGKHTLCVLCQAALWWRLWAWLCWSKWNNNNNNDNSINNLCTQITLLPRSVVYDKKPADKLVQIQVLLQQIISWTASSERRMSWVTEGTHGLQ